MQRVLVGCFIVAYIYTYIYTHTHIYIYSLHLDDQTEISEFFMNGCGSLAAWHCGKRHIFSHMNG